ncbi:MAG TPA: hypothetical protein VK061_02960 [Bacillota bacterium]|nr:hypothetical protein [Bacillota bacterium]
MKNVMDVIHKKKAKEKLPILKLEIDYELLTLYDAMQVKDDLQIKRSKKRLHELRLKWMDIMNM